MEPTALFILWLFGAIYFWTGKDYSDKGFYGILAAIFCSAFWFAIGAFMLVGFLLLGLVSCRLSTRTKIYLSILALLAVLIYLFIL